MAAKKPTLKTLQTEINDLKHSLHWLKLTVKKIGEEVSRFEEESPVTKFTAKLRELSSALAADRDALRTLIEEGGDLVEDAESATTELDDALKSMEAAADTLSQRI